jgi:hypothetical protein
LKEDRMGKHPHPSSAQRDHHFCVLLREDPKQSRESFQRGHAGNSDTPFLFSSIVTKFEEIGIGADPKMESFL